MAQRRFCSVRFDPSRSLRNVSATPAAGEHGAEGAAGGAAADVGSLTVGHDGDPSYYNMPKMIVNLAGSNGSSQLLELALTLEASDAAAFDEVPGTMPRLRDQFQSFLRELRVEDLNGSAGSYRLRVELLRRFNAVMAPTGNSLGAMIVRATASATITNSAPPRAAAGMLIRLSLPSESLARCGTTSPT